MNNCSEQTTNPLLSEKNPPNENNKIQTCSNSDKNKLPLYHKDLSPIYEYFHISHSYLQKKYSQNKIHFKSNNFLPKDPNELETEESSNLSANLCISEQNTTANNNNNINLLPDTTNLYFQQQFQQFPFFISQNKNLNDYQVNNNFTKYLCFQMLFNQPKIDKINQNSSNVNLNSDEYITEMFGKRGWICSLCSNFNYETRKKCNKCSEPKNPKRINHINNNSQMTETDINNNKDNTFLNGDWVCNKCENVNYAFRVVCNRCQFLREKSNVFSNKHP